MAGIVQCTYRPKFRADPIKIAFNAGNLVISTVTAYLLMRRVLPVLRDQSEVVCLILGAAAFYIVNTSLVSIVLALVEHGSLAAVWKHWCFGSLPYYFVGVLLMGSSNPIVYGLAVIVIPAILLGAVFVKLVPERNCGKWVNE